VTGAVVYVDEVADPRGGKKIRNFQNIRRQSPAAAQAERDASEAALALAERARHAAEAAAAAGGAAVGPDGQPVAADDSFLGSIGSGFSQAQAQIDAQLKNVAEQAMSLPGNIAGGIQAAGADVTTRLNALISLLDRVNQKPPEETEDEKRKKRKLIVELEALHFTDWNIHILAGCCKLKPVLIS